MNAWNLSGGMYCSRAAQTRQRDFAAESDPRSGAGVPLLPHDTKSRVAAAIAAPIFQDRTVSHILQPLCVAHATRTSYSCRIRHGILCIIQRRECTFRIASAKPGPGRCPAMIDALRPPKKLDRRVRVLGVGRPNSSVRSVPAISATAPDPSSAPKPSSEGSSWRFGVMPSPAELTQLERHPPRSRAHHLPPEGLRLSLLHR